MVILRINFSHNRIMELYVSGMMSAASWWLLGCGSACLLAAMVIYLLRTTKVIKASNICREAPQPSSLPGVSVIVYSQDDAENLENLLNSLLNQEYSGEYEIVVVNDGESVDVKELVAMKRRLHNNLYLTFTPEGVRNLSRKKLGITLGVKAARHGILALTTTATYIPSPRWLASMVRGFQPPIQADVVLGFAGAEPPEENHAGDRRRTFDFVAESARWLSAALNGNPYRGTEFNLAYRKALFLENSGFAKSLNLHYGDDDIFVSEIARGNNTHVELAPDARVYVRGGAIPRFHNEQMVRRCFTESFIRRHKPFGIFLAGLLQIAGWVLLVCAALLALPNLLAAICGLGMILFVCVINIVAWRPVTKELGHRPLRLTIPWLSATYPLRKIVWKLRAKFGKGRKYTWN